MTLDEIVEGPAWVSSGLDEPAGRYPLRVEPAVGRLVEKLLPGIITTTTGARYFGLHALAWSEAHKQSDPEAFVRRCEAVLAGVYWQHERSSTGHQRQVPSAHGESEVPKFMSSGTFDLSAASARGGYSSAGFAGTYFAPERAIGLLRGTWPPQPGPRADLAVLQESLGDVLHLARSDTLTLSELENASHLCPCQAATSADGAWLRAVMFETVPTDDESLNRQVTALMLLEALEGGSHHDPESAFRLAHGFGIPIEGTGAEATIRRAWRAAVLRNYSVSAWRHLWAWLTDHLAQDELSANELADRLAQALGNETVRDFVANTPRRCDGSELLPVEEQVRESDEDAPRRALRHLVLGTQRLADLDPETYEAFLGLPSERMSDLGPLWFAHQLREHENSVLATLATDLVDTMLQRARRVALSKMRLDPKTLRPYLPTRLRERDGFYSVTSPESDAEVSLRGWTLAQVLSALGAIDRPDGTYALSPVGEAMAATLRTAASAP